MSYTYEKVQLKAGRKLYILSQHKDDHWEGPAIEHYAKENVTKIGVYSDDRKFKLEFSILKPNGSEYTVKVCKDGYPSGPSVVVVDEAMYIGRYYAKDGFNGIVYRLKQGENIRIQDYKHGVLTKESEFERVVEEDVAMAIPFDGCYECSIPSVKSCVVGGVKKDQFIAGDYTIKESCVLAAETDGQNNVRIGQYRDKNFNGFAMDFSSETNTCSFSFYENGKKLDAFNLLYQPEIDGYALIMPNSDESYTNYVYREKNNKFMMSVMRLDKKQQPTKDFVDLPNEIDYEKNTSSLVPFVKKKLVTSTKKGVTATQKLQEMIGLSEVKNEIAKLKAMIAKNPSKIPTLNIAFMGNPGTGKTEVARLFASILNEIGVLPTNKVVETDRSGLVAEYIGHTAIKTHKIVKSAIGGVLFIDEAYSLCDNDFGKEAIDALIADMENYRGQMCFILAGYKQPLLDMIDKNKGFKSRINRFFDFKNYTQDELKQIASKKLVSDGYQMNDETLNEAIKIVSKRMYADDFGNAREVRNLLEKLYEFQAARTVFQNKKDMEITMEDIYAYTKKDAPAKVNNLTAEQRLNNLIGLNSVKKEILKMKAVLSKCKGDLGKTNLHMCFYGNPGTGKTEVARLLANILYDEGILPENKFIETDRSGLVAEYLGQTAIKTHKKVKDSLGGVLFIDEAYSLASGSGNDYGYSNEAIDALLVDMETYRGKFCVILAGYEPQMEQLFSMNPGFKSRINRYITFPDYSKDELLEIAKSMLSAKKYTITEDALNEMGKLIDIEKNSSDFANARTIRNMLESIYEIQALRTYKEDISDSWLIKLCDIEEYKKDKCIIL